MEAPGGRHTKRSKNMNIGSTISELRKKANMTQSEVAEQLGVSFQAVSKWERDESLPDITLSQAKDN